MSCPRWGSGARRPPVAVAMILGGTSSPEEAAPEGPPLQRRPLVWHPLAERPRSWCYPVLDDQAPPSSAPVHTRPGREPYVVDALPGVAIGETRRVGREERQDDHAQGGRRGHGDAARRRRLRDEGRVSSSERALGREADRHPG